MMTRLGLAAFLWLAPFLHPAAAQDVRPGPADPAARPSSAASGQISEDEVKELVAVFREMCLNRFPDDAALDAAAAATGMARMSEEAVRGYLRADPGHGWFYRTPAAEYAITVEHPPVRACGVRRMTPAGAGTARPFVEAASEWAMRERGQLVTLPPRRAGSGGGAAVTAVPFALVDGSGKPVQSLLVVLTDHRVQQGGTGVEIRLVRQIIPTDSPAR